MREARLARPQVRAAADDRGGRGAVMRRPERRAARRAARSSSTRPATEWIRVTSSAASESSGGRIPGRRRASIVFPVPGGPPRRTLCPPAAASSSARRARSWPRTSARSGTFAGSVAVRRERRLRLQLELAAQVGDGLGEVPDRDRGDAGERRLAGGVGRAEEALGTEPPRALGDGEHAADPAQATVERELADRSGALERAARQLLRRREQRERDREVEARSPPCAARPARD